MLLRIERETPMNTYHVLFNPHAGNGHGEEEARKLDTLLTDVSLCYHNITEVEDYAAFFSAIPAEEDVILCGGDGTINRFVNATEGLTYPNDILYFGVGSGNDFMHDLGKKKGDAPFSIKKYLQDLPVVTVKGRTYRFRNGIGYGKLAMYVLPTVLFVAWLGFETIGRTAKCFALLLLIVLAASILTASSEFETYRLYPFPGSNIGLLTRQAFSQSGAFLPALLSLLITCTGLQGTHHAKKAGVIAALISAAVCAAAQLAVSLAFTYTELGDLFMPLFRINNLKSLETHLLRMDKLAHIAWLTGGMLTGSFYIYSASLLFSQVFGVRDIRPVLSSNVLLVGLLIIIDFEGIMRFLPDPRAANAEYGFIFIAVPTALAAFIGAVSAKKRRKHS